jgi:inner membrane protein
LDNLTHGLVGAAISKAGGERITPLATATLVIAANAPDIDVLSYFGGEYFALSFRRGITHGWPAMIVLPFLVTGAMLAWDRHVRRRRHPEAPPARPGALLGLAGLGVATHPALDWMNTYGMRWGLPFDPSWT